MYCNCESGLLVAAIGSNCPARRRALQDNQSGVSRDGARWRGSRLPPAERSCNRRNCCARTEGIRARRVVPRAVTRAQHIGTVCRAKTRCCEKNGGSAWESNPPAAWLTYGPTVLKTVADTSRTSTSPQSRASQSPIYSPHAVLQIPPACERRSLRGVRARSVPLREFRVPETRSGRTCTELHGGRSVSRSERRKSQERVRDARLD